MMTGVYWLRQKEVYTMNVLDKMKGWAVIQAAIDTAWANPDGRMLQARLFPKGKPSPEEFVIVIAHYLRS